MEREKERGKKEREKNVFVVVSVAPKKKKNFFFKKINVSSHDLPRKNENDKIFICLLLMNTWFCFFFFLTEN